MCWYAAHRSQIPDRRQWHFARFRSDSAAARKPRLTSAQLWAHRRTSREHAARIVRLRGRGLRSASNRSTARSGDDTYSPCQGEEESGMAGIDERGPRQCRVPGEKTDRSQRRDDYSAIRKAIDELNEGTMRLAELMMDTAVSTALKGKAMDDTGLKKGTRWTSSGEGGI